jgi:hypothetical protein
MKKLIFFSFLTLAAGIAAWFKGNIIFIIFSVSVVVLPLVTILIIRQLGKASSSRIIANSIFCWLCNYKDETEERYIKLKKQHARQVVLEKLSGEDD